MAGWEGCRNDKRGPRTIACHSRPRLSGIGNNCKWYYAGLCGTRRDKIRRIKGLGAIGAAVRKK